MGLIYRIRQIEGAPRLASGALRLLANVYCSLVGERSRDVRAVRDGITFRLDLREDVQMRIWSNSFDRAELDLLGRYLKPGDVAIDVGAQVGYFTLHFAREVGSTGRVMAFEPDPRNVARLRRNLRANSFATNVTIVETALSDQTGKATLFRTSDDHSGGNSLHSELGGSVDSMTVPVMRLDDYCEENQVDRVRVLKIDVEGHEQAVLRGAGRLLRLHLIDAVLLEYIPSRVRQLGDDGLAFDSSLTENGYVRIEPAVVPEVDNVFNLLYVAPHVLAAPRTQ